MFSPDSKVRCQKVVTRIKELIASYSHKFSKQDAAKLIDSILTMDFFLKDDMPLDAVAVNRIDAEITLCRGVVAPYGCSI